MGEDITLGLNVDGNFDETVAAATSLQGIIKGTAESLEAIATSLSDGIGGFTNALDAAAKVIDTIKLDARDTLEFLREADTLSARIALTTGRLAPMAQGSPMSYIQQQAGQSGSSVQSTAPASINPDPTPPGLILPGAISGGSSGRGGGGGGRRTGGGGGYSDGGDYPGGGGWVGSPNNGGFSGKGMGSGVPTDGDILDAMAGGTTSASVEDSTTVPNRVALNQTYYLPRVLRRILNNNQLNEAILGSDTGQAVGGAIGGVGNAVTEFLKGNGFSYNPTDNPWIGGPKGDLGSTVAGIGVLSSIAGMTQMGYGLTSRAFQEGQLFTSLTGGTSIKGALGQDFGAQLSSWFGLNPLESYGAAKQIRMNALAQGYGNNSALEGQAVNFGNYALQRYGISPDQSAALFQQSVVQMSASANTLQNALDNLSGAATNGQQSFQAMIHTYQQALPVAQQMGMSGSAAVNFASAAATQYIGQLPLQGTGTAAGILGTTMGQAMTAQNLGTNYMNMFAFGAGYGGTGTKTGNEYLMAQAAGMTLTHMLNLAGITKDSSDETIAMRHSYALLMLQNVMSPEEFAKTAALDAPNWKKWVRDQFQTGAGANTTAGSQERNAITDSVKRAFTADGAAYISSDGSGISDPKAAQTAFNKSIEAAGLPTAMTHQIEINFKNNMGQWFEAYQRNPGQFTWSTIQNYKKTTGNKTTITNGLN